MGNSININHFRKDIFIFYMEWDNKVSGVQSVGQRTEFPFSIQLKDIELTVKNKVEPCL
jgi:hypothetical protein